jgi:hypothetical protein
MAEMQGKGKVWERVGLCPNVLSAREGGKSLVLSASIACWNTYNYLIVLRGIHAPRAYRLRVSTWGLSSRCRSMIARYGTSIDPI